VSRLLIAVNANSVNANVETVYANVEERLSGPRCEGKEMGFSLSGRLMERISRFTRQVPVNAHNFHSRLYIAGTDTSN
jgi:hypothetical protein